MLPQNFLMVYASATELNIGGQSRTSDRAKATAIALATA